MKSNVLAIAAAFLSMTAAAVQASPATVVPDAAHAVVKDTKQIVGGTYKGVSDQARHDVTAAKRTTRHVRHSVSHAYGRRHHHHRHAIVHSTTRTTSTASDTAG